MNPADVAAVVAQFTDAGLATDLDPSKVEIPGAWLQLVTVDLQHLAGGVTYTANLVLITGDNNHDQVLESLAGLYEAADPVLAVLGGTTGPGRFVTVTTPDGPLPGLSVPFEIDTE